ncbi:PREDICTED: tumor protein p53-inducible nuclear protein 2 [Myotis davidii]|uniref:tumor protein p53-inducible nuclear protein 2 n=1 Tax=Myotis davidii TaxID=225400 RepID=UPI0003EC640A|nr:PREDICTED: tumor protein p53-inducible nuclear protein 2 [Myotis davidii]
MFQRLTSMFFRNPPPPEDLDCPRAFVSEEDEVDGWLIIDLPGESAKVMQRQNRARESHPRRPKHQGNFIYQPCQRQFNY